MEDFNEKYYKQKITVVNSYNVNRVNYRHKVNKTKFRESLIVTSFIVILWVNIMGILLYFLGV